MLLIGIQHIGDYIGTHPKKNTDEKFLLDMPDKFNEEWTDFNENYK